MTTYVGRRVGTDAKAWRIVNGKSTELLQRQDLVNHSPDGFEWGYGGSGPAQLALAILADHLADDAKAVPLHIDYLHQVIARLPRDEVWAIDAEEVEAFVARTKGVWAVTLVVEVEARDRQIAQDIVGTGELQLQGAPVPFTIINADQIG